MSTAQSWARLVEQNLIAYFQHMARARPSGVLAEQGGVLVAAAGVRFHMFNAAFLSSPAGDGEEEISARLGQAARLLGNNDDGWSLWLCDEKAPGGLSSGQRAELERWGLEFAYRHPAMAAAALSPPSRQREPLDIRPVGSRQSRADFSFINAMAFRVPFEWCMELYDLETLWDGEMAGWVGYRNGTAVASASVLMTGRVAGLYAVATLPEFQRRGFGEAMVRHAAHWAGQTRQAELLVLQSTREGEPLYRRLGFHTVTHFTVYAT